MTWKNPITYPLTLTLRLSGAILCCRFERLATHDLVRPSSALQLTGLPTQKIDQNLEDVCGNRSCSLFSLQPVSFS
jgi:hypothetical protein